MDKKLNWGLLSTAKINQALIKPLRASNRTRLLAVASRSISNAEAYAREWNIPRAHGSYEALLADPEIDVVYNSLPNHLHAEWTIKALHAGKHVLCEKPFALTLADVDAMSQAARETGKVLEEAFMYRHHAQTLKVKEIVDSGMLGKLQLVKGAFSFMLTRKDDIRSKKETGGGSIWDIGCYPISYARMIIGAEPVEVFGWQVSGQDGVDESFFGQMKFEDGVHAQFDSGFKAPFRTMIEIVGTKASLTITEPFKPHKTTEIILTSDDKQEKIKIKANELYLGEVEDMCDAITQNKAPRISHADSRGNIATILALLESARLGKPVTPMHS
jgi:predicted dehydrogenase